MTGIHDAIADELAWTLEWSARNHSSKAWAERRKAIWSLLRNVTADMEVGGNEIVLAQVEHACGLVLDCLRATTKSEPRPFEEAAVMIEKVRALKLNSSTPGESRVVAAKISTGGNGIRTNSLVTHPNLPQVIMRVVEIKGDNAQCNWPAPYGKNSESFPLRELAKWPSA